MPTHKRSLTFTGMIRVIIRPKRILVALLVLVPLAMVQVMADDRGWRVIEGFVNVAAVLVFTSMLRRWAAAEKAEQPGPPG